MSQDDRNIDLLINLSISNAHLVLQWSNGFIRFVKNCLRIFSCCLEHNYNLDDSVASIVGEIDRFLYVATLPIPDSFDKPRQKFFSNPNVISRN